MYIYIYKYYNKVLQVYTCTTHRCIHVHNRIMYSVYLQPTKYTGIVVISTTLVLLRTAYSARSSTSAQNSLLSTVEVHHRITTSGYIQDNNY